MKETRAPSILVRDAQCSKVIEKELAAKKSLKTRNENNIVKEEGD